MSKVCPLQSAEPGNEAPDNWLEVTPRARARMASIVGVSEQIGRRLEAAFSTTEDGLPFATVTNAWGMAVVFAPDPATRLWSAYVIHKRETVLTAPTLGKLLRLFADRGGYAPRTVAPPEIIAFPGG